MRYRVVLQQAQKRGSWTVEVEASSGADAERRAMVGRPHGTRVVAVKRPRPKRGERR